MSRNISAATLLNTETQAEALEASPPASKPDSKLRSTKKEPVMSTSDQTLADQSGRLRQPKWAAAAPAGATVKTESATSHRAWVAKSSKQPMALEVVEFGTLG